jgi:hypothetical protein
MSTQAKPSIVFAHGLWADGSAFEGIREARGTLEVQGIKGDIGVLDRGIWPTNTAFLALRNRQSNSIAFLSMYSLSRAIT